MGCVGLGRSGGVGGVGAWKWVWGLWGYFHGKQGRLRSSLVGTFWRQHAGGGAGDGVGGGGGREGKEKVLLTQLVNTS